MDNSPKSNASLNSESSTSEYSTQQDISEDPTINCIGLPKESHVYVNLMNATLEKLTTYLKRNTNIPEKQMKTITNYSNTIKETTLNFVAHLGHVASLENIVKNDLPKAVVQLTPVSHKPTYAETAANPMKQVNILLCSIVGKKPELLMPLYAGILDRLSNTP